LLDRLVAVISAPPAALRYELVIADDVNRSDATARTAELAAALMARGMPPATLSVGVTADTKGAGAGSLRFTFIILDATSGSVAVQLVTGGAP
jgi:hypothetical protein